MGAFSKTIIKLLTAIFQPLMYDPTMEPPLEYRPEDRAVKQEPPDPRNSILFLLLPPG